MRSIRLSLVLYFLLLLGAALGAVSYFSYQSTQSALEAKENSTKALLIKKSQEDEARILADFDLKVFKNARELGQKIILYHNRVEPLYVVGMIAAAPPNSGLFTLLPLAESTQPKIVRFVATMRTHAEPRVQQLHSDEEHFILPPIEDGEYYQTYLVAMTKGPTPPPSKQRDPPPFEASESLGGLVWQLDKNQKLKADDAARPLDDVKLKTGQTVRRITLKVPVNLEKIGVMAKPVPPLTDLNYSPAPIPWESKTAAEIRGPAGRRPLVYLQYGLDTAERDRAVADSKKQLEERLAGLTVDLDQARDLLGRQLFWVSLGAFAAVVVGGFCLVRVGLSPLQRLSEAVSKVSEKDFRLPIDHEHLPEELKPIADRLSQTLDQLRRVFEREKQAAADISHELRTPVAALLTTLDITLRKPRSAEEYHEVLEDCRSSGKQINQIVERLLTLARLNAGADVMRPREVDVNMLADQCVTLVRPLAEARGLKLAVHRNGPAPMNADPDKLREVLTNLLHNAIEYNKPNGLIDVEVARNNGTLEMTVRDTGIGISPEACQRIFERFYRADPSRHADETPHAGLGLAIVKGYVELMGGSIDVDSKVGEGSTFHVRLPVN